MAVQALLAVLLNFSLLAFEASGGGIVNTRGFRVVRGSEQSVLEGLSPWKL